MKMLPNCNLPPKKCRYQGVFALKDFEKNEAKVTIGTKKSPGQETKPEA
jgi:hypothetical protein